MTRADFNTCKFCTECASPAVPERLVGTAPIRIILDTTYLDSDDNPYRCRFLGDTVRIGAPVSALTVCTETEFDDCWFNCTSDDIFSTAKVTRSFQLYLYLAYIPSECDTG